MEAIRKIMESIIPAVLDDSEGKGCFILNCKSEIGSGDPELRKWLINNQEQSISLFKELVTEGQKEGLINNAYNAETHAYSLFNTFQGLRMTGILTRNTKVLQNIIENTIDNIQ